MVLQTVDGKSKMRIADFLHSDRTSVVGVPRIPARDRALDVGNGGRVQHGRRGKDLDVEVPEGVGLLEVVVEDQDPTLG